VLLPTIPLLPKVRACRCYWELQRRPLLAGGLAFEVRGIEKGRVDELAKREVDSAIDFKSVFGKSTRVHFSPTGSYEAG
jgi:hypothetical protein